MDPLFTNERVIRDIALGESHFREFKSAFQGAPSERTPRDKKSVARDISEALVAFANADGGELLIGVEDDGSITGLTFKEETMTYLRTVPTTHIHCDTPLVGVTSQLLEVDGKDILYFSIEKSTHTVHQTSDGRCLQRSDKENLPVSLERLKFERGEQQSREYDRQFVEGASIGDLDVTLVQKVFHPMLPGTSTEKILQFLSLAEYGAGFLRVKRAALLLFATDILRWHPRCEVRIFRVKGTELKTGREYNVVSDDISSGNIFSLMVDAWDRLRPHLVETKFVGGAVFKEQVMYPEDACREALINALAHRDYSNEGRGTEIYVFDDRMEVQSPGGLLSTVRIDDLRKLTGVHQSRNATITRSLREAGYMREMGEGMRRIFHLMRASDLVPPVLDTSNAQFRVTLSHRSIFSPQDQAWLDEFKPLTLSREEMLVALLGRGGSLISTQQIWDALELVDTDAYRAIIEQMQMKGIIRNTKSKSSKGNSRRGGPSRRAVPRYEIRNPELCNAEIAELLDSLRLLPTNTVLDSKYCSTLLNQLSESNHYKGHHSAWIYALLHHLGLIDERRYPTSHLETIWLAAPRISPPRNAVETTEGSQTVAATRAAESSSDPKQKAVLFIGNLHKDFTRDQIDQFFSKVGTVTNIAVPAHSQSLGADRYAFVTLLTQMTAENIVALLNGQVIAGRSIRVGLPRERA